MADRNQEETVVIKYIGPGGSASGISEYRESGSGRVETGDEITVPADFAARAVLNSDFVYADGTEVEGAVEREDPNSGESPVAGLAADDEVYDGTYEDQVREREEAGNATDPGSSEVTTRVHERIQQLAAEDAASETEGEAGDGEPSDERSRRSVNE